MKRLNNKYSRSVIAGVLLFAAASCKKDYTDPSGPTSDQAISSATALTDVAVGLQNWYTANRTSTIYSSVTSSSLLTGETFIVNAGNADENQLYLGGASVQNTNAVVTSLWTVCNKIIYDANRVLDNTNTVITDKNYASGVIGYTSIFKALAIGNMAMFWDHVPDTVGTDVAFITSKQGYEKAVAIINNALSTISANAISSSFSGRVPAGIDVVNTLNALKARYALFAGDYTTALAAANLVTTTSSFTFNATITNPIFTLVTASNNIYQVVDLNMGLPAGLQPDAADLRLPFYIGTNTTIAPLYRVKGYYSAITQSIPVYLPGEITLIKAECYARQNNLADGLTELNKVVTKQPAADAFGVGAGLPEVSAVTIDELLTLIYKNRRIELFMSGLALEDERRFGRPTTERKRTWFPFPFVERNDNSNIPDDPAF
jgi:hypothetical protein